MKGWLGITLGDPSGVGPEVALKALARTKQDEFKYLLLGDVNLIASLNKSLDLRLPLAPFQSYQQEGRFFYLQAGPTLPASVVCGSKLAAEAAMAALTEGARRSIAGELDGIVTAPVNKEAIIRLGPPFMGQTEYLSEMAGADRTAMMLLGADDRGRWLRVALVTTHIPLRAVADKLTRPKIVQTIELAAQACRDLGSAARACGSLRPEPSCG